VGPRTGLDMVAKCKIPSPLQDSNPIHPIVQPVVSRYTDWAMSALLLYLAAGEKCLLKTFRKNYMLFTALDHGFPLNIS
jgi:hypothetical protein